MIMKKLFMLLFVTVAMFKVFETNAQNVQLFYDAGRNCATSTVEMFSPDSFGSTYFFVDVDYSAQSVLGKDKKIVPATGAYWEIARELCFWQDTDWAWLSAHIEYNGGLSNTMSYNNCWLAGVTYSGHSKDFSKTWSLSAMYKLIPGTYDILGRSQVHNFQITGVWGINFAKGWCSFSGFFDFWREHRSWQGTDFIFMSEPQFWVNLNQIEGWEKIGLSIGGELELSANFIKKGFHVMPAIGAKWSF